MDAWLLIGITASLSSLLTWLVAFGLYRVVIAPRWRAELRDAQEQFEHRVHDGVKAAGEELLPAFREQVSLGFQDAMSSSSTAGLVEDTAKAVSRSKRVFDEGLKSLFGEPPRR